MSGLLLLPALALLTLALALACTPDGPAACKAAGGLCVLGGGHDCVKRSDHDCNPQRHPGGGVCCLKFSKGERAGSGG